MAVLNWKYHLSFVCVIWVLLCMYQPDDWSKISVHSVVWMTIQMLNSVKMFVIFHDCGHLSFIPNGGQWNEYLAHYFLSLLLATPFRIWQKGHNKHHSIQGDLNKVDTSATIHFTVNDIKNFKNKYLKFIYMVWRFPPLFFLTSNMVIYYAGFPILSIVYKHYYNLMSHIIVPCCFGYFHGWKHSFAVYFALHLLRGYFSGIFAVMLFHIEHAQNPAYRKTKATGYNSNDVAVYGSSYHPVPFFIKPFTMGIEYHHIHHFDAKIPGYALHQYQYEKLQKNDFKYSIPKSKRVREFDHRLADVTLMSYSGVWECLWHVAYCEKRQRYVTWAECIKDVYGYDSDVKKQ